MLPLNHPLAQEKYIEARELSDEVLFSYPVEVERLDVFSQFFLPADCAPRKHKTIETTDIMLQMVAAGRGVAALPNWLVAEYANKMPIRGVRMGKRGVNKQIFLGQRESNFQEGYLAAFMALAAAV